MKISKLPPFLRISSLFGLAAAVVLSASSAEASTANLAKFVGTFNGTHVAQGTFITLSGSTSGASKAVFKSSQASQAGKLTLSGTDTASRATYTATLQFKKGGAASTTAIVPGIVNVGGTGTWKLSSAKKLSFTLSAVSAAGEITVKGTLQTTGKALKLASSGSLTSPFGSGSGSYNFSGTK